MLKRVRSKNPFDLDEWRKIPSSRMANSNAQSGDKTRICAFTTESCQILNELRKKNLLCDAKISIRNQFNQQCIEYPVHRFILAGMSSSDTQYSQ